MEISDKSHPHPPACPYCKTPLPNIQLLGLMFRSVVCMTCNSTIKLQGGPIITLVSSVVGLVGGVALARFGFSAAFITSFATAMGMVYAIEFWLLKSGLISQKNIRLKCVKPHVCNDGGCL